MIRKLWWVITLPVRLIRLPFKIVSAAMSILIYLTFFAILGIGVYLYFL